MEVVLGKNLEKVNFNVEVVLGKNLEKVNFKVEVVLGKNLEKWREYRNHADYRNNFIFNVKRAEKKYEIIVEILNELYENP